MRVEGRMNILYIFICCCCFVQYKTVLTPPPEYLEALKAMKEANGTDAGNMTMGKPSMCVCFLFRAWSVQEKKKT